MKWNWGMGIVVVAASFVIFILNLVYRCSNERVDLVSDRYYENELRYEERLHSQRNVNQDRAGIKFRETNNSLTLIYPAKALNGTVNFFRPDDSRLDFNLPVQPDDSSRQHLSLSELKKGIWRVQVSWSAGRSPYYEEHEIRIN